MIINTGLRTDIPAFYSEWFLNRLKEGRVLVRNPFFPQKITKYVLNPKVVDLICFCSKNPIPMLDKMDALKDYRQLWFVSITGYGRKIEPGVPNKFKVIEAFQKISNIVGQKNIVWRYDPIFIAGSYTYEYHLRAFEKIASLLKDYTDTVVISFIDIYEKVKRNFPGVLEVPKDVALKLATEMVSIAKKYGMRVQSCAEGDYLSAVGVDTSGCMTREVLERAIGCEFKKFPKIKNRVQCNCLLNADIGAYDSCPHLCRYCYANSSKEAVVESFRKHDPKSPLLIGHLEEGDIVTEAKQETWIDPQMHLPM